MATAVRARVERLRSEPALRDRFGAHALGGSSAILAAVVWLLHGDEPQSESPRAPLASRIRSAIDVVGRDSDRQVHHDQTQPAQAALLDSAAGAVDGANDDARRLGGGVGVFGDEE